MAQKLLTIDELGNKKEIIINADVPQALRLDGDSFGITGGTTQAKRFGDRVARAGNFTLTNASEAGHETVDVYTAILGAITVPTTYGYHLINAGFNDVRRFGNNSLVGKAAANYLKAMVSYLRLGQITDSLDAAITYSGTWTTFELPCAYGGSLRYTSELNATATFNFSGDCVTIGAFYLVSSGGTMEIKVDGVTKFTKVMDSEAVNGYAAAPIELTGLGAGAHSCVVKCTTSSGNIYFDYFGIPSSTPPIIIVNGLTRMKTASYPLYDPYDNGNDAAILATNKTIHEALMTTYDERVIFVDQSNFDPNNYNLIDTDNIHPSDYGHAWIANNILAQRTEFSTHLPVWELIAESVCASDVASVDFSSIVSGYKHFLVLINACSDNTSNDYWLLVRFNNDSGNNYIDNTSGTADASIILGGTASLHTLPRYNSTYKFTALTQLMISNFNPARAKTIAGTVVTVAAATPVVSGGVVGGAWRNTAAEINRITFLASTGNIKTGSSFRLYGTRA